MLDSEHENPELIWNEDTRKKVAKVVSEECGKLFQSQKQSSETLWSVPENFQLSLEDVSGEVVVSGVYLRLFAANPGWVLRRPKQFMEDLLENMLVTSEVYNIAKLQLNSQLHLHSNPTSSPLQVYSTPPSVELELCHIFGLYHHQPTLQITFLNYKTK